MAKTATPTKAKVTRGPTTVLPSTVTSEEVTWPGSGRGGGSRNVELRDQLRADLEGMEFGSVRRYNLTGDKEQNTFLSLFRKVCDEVHEGEYGVQTVKREDHVVVKLGARKSS